MGGIVDSVKVMLGFRADFRTSVMLGVEGSAPGAGAADGLDFGGAGCGGDESLGRTYCSSRNGNC